MLGTLRGKGRLRRVRTIWEGAAAQFGALVLAAIVAALVQVPFAADQIAKADPPPPPSELLQLRTQTSRTVDNHDGTYTTSLYSGPVHYRSAQGQWRAISSAVVPTTESGYGLENEANRFRTLFKSTSANDFLALETGGGRFKVALQNAAQVAVQPGTRKVTYPGVFPGVDLRYDLRPDGVKETLLLQNAQAPTSYRFLLTPPANARIHPAQRADGSWAFFMAPHARPVFVIDAPWAAEHDEPVANRSHASLAVTRLGDVFALDLSVDGPWLRATGRQFPVRLDPTITIQPTIQDASFNFACSGCSGVASDRLSIGTGSIGLATNTWRSALQFSLADIPPGAVISNAKLKLYFDGTCVTAPGPACGGTSHQIDALRMTSSWSPSSKTSQLVFDTTPLSSFTLPASAPAQWMNWDITGTVQDWVSGGTPSNFGLLLKRSTEPANTSGPKPPSRNYAAEPTLGPTLQVTYNGDGGELLEPETVHANGAELSWIPYGGPGAPPFSSYEVHRSSSPSFTPSDSTRLTKILDSAVTAYRDTTAKASGTFTYKVVVNGWETNSRTVTMPAAGQAKKLLRPLPETGRTSYLGFRNDSIDCINRGASDRVRVGTDVNSVFRPLIRFDLGKLPIDTTVSQATLSLWHPETSGATALTVRTHRLTADWEEGGGTTSCTGDGATWYETTGGVEWSSLGGDFDAAAAATVSVPAEQPAGWHGFNVAALVQEWARGEKPNHGVLLKLDDESIVPGKYLEYYADDFSVAPALRPKLSIVYTETTSSAVAPTVSVSKPVGGERVKGTAVPVSATAVDDRRVDQVEFLVDGNSIGTDTSEPFSVNWNSTSIGNGTHNLMARATDDAGNQATSAAATVTVGNSAVPSTSITSPAGGTVSGTVAFSASATDDVGVTKVVFLVDGLTLAEDTSAPYSTSWNTLDPALPAYDGQHTLTTKAYDAHDQVTTSTPVTVTVANAAGTKYLAEYASAPFPPRMEQGQQYSFDVTVTNKSGVIWGAGDVLLRYRWFTLDSTVSLSDSAGTSVGMLLPNGSTIINVSVQPPSLPAGVARQGYRLRFDLYDQPSASWFAARGNKPLEEVVTVGSLAREQTLGVEPYYHYVSEELGVGMQNHVNVATGDSLLRWAPVQAPGEGISTAVELTYNSREGNCNAHECPVGEGWSLAISSLTRFGNDAFVVHPPGNPNTVTLIDVDGTTHAFTLENGKWKAPNGVHLYLREVTPSVPCTRDPGGPGAEWAVTRPDGVTYYYDQLGGGRGYPLLVRDRNGNELCYESTGGSGNRKVTRVFDQGGRTFDLNYAANHELVSIEDHLDHKLLFCRTQPRTLVAIWELTGTSTDCAQAIGRKFDFIHAGGNVSDVYDPRGNRTSFTYLSDDKLASRTDRSRAVPTSFSYPSGETTVTAPLSRISRYRYITASPNENSVDRITNPKLEETLIEWTAAPQPLRHVKKVTEPGGGTTEYLYNANGLVTEEKVLTKLGTPNQYSTTQYQYIDSWVEGGDQSVLAISDLEKRTDPNGVATPGVPNDYQWTYEYFLRGDGKPNGNLKRLTDPTGANTDHAYYQNDRWKLQSVTDARGKPTTYEDYDANGFARKVTDAKGQITRSCYDAGGLMIWSQDPLHASETEPLCPATGGREYRTVNEYDTFHRLIRQSSPKSTRFDRGRLIWTETEYDHNNNVTAERQPDYAPGRGDRSTMHYDNMDRQTRITEPEATEITTFEYDAAGRLTKTTLPRGVDTPAISNDYVTENGYDVLDRLVTEKRYDADGFSTRRTHYCFDAAGDVRWMTAPKAGLTDAPTSCTGTPPRYTTRYTYDLAHRQLTETEPLNTELPPPNDLTRTRTLEYDANGNITAEIDEEATREDREYSQRDELVKTIKTFDKDVTPHRRLTTVLVYDGVGNLIREVSPRAWDACAPPPGNGCDPGVNGNHVAEYRYDDVNQLDRIALPDDADNARTYVHRRYDANGNLTLSTLPVENDELTSPPTIPDNQKTEFEYWDAGWIFSSHDHVMPRVLFDYEAEGWQARRTVCCNIRYEQMNWTYYPDGELHVVTDRSRSGFVEHKYDLNDNLVVAIEKRGLVNKRQTPYTIRSDYNGFDELQKTRQRQDLDLNYRFTAYTYDANGNLATREDNGEETQQGASVSVGRLHVFTYDEANQETAHRDRGKTHSDNEWADDQQIRTDYRPAGWQQQQIVERATGPSSWQQKLRTNWTYFANGDLKLLQTRNAADALVEEHTLGYLANGIYLNGNRVSDQFLLKGPDGTAPCFSGTCTTTYRYGPRENLVEEARTRSGLTQTTCYRLDPAMNVSHVWEIPCQPNPPPAPRRFVYDGNRLTEEHNEQGLQRRFFYDPDGNIECVTSASGTSDDCRAPYGASVSGSLKEVYEWDYLNRLESVQQFSGATRTLDSDYEQDPLNRLVREDEVHTPGGSRTTCSLYLGLSAQVSEEKHFALGGCDQPTPQTTKTYSYGADDERLSMTKVGGPPLDTGEHYFSRNMHADVSLLLRGDGTSRASYVYKPYGGQDGLSRADLESQDPLNAYRFNDKRYDSGSSTLDMGARRYSSDVGRFLQQDGDTLAHDDGSFSIDPTTQNRYAFALANPLSFAETDGHRSRPLTNVYQSAGELFSLMYWQAQFARYRVRHTAALLATVFVIAANRSSWRITVDRSNPLAGAGPKGGTGYPDIIARKGKRALVWEIKPNSEYGWRSGPVQMERYLTALRRQRIQATRGDWLLPRSIIAPTPPTGELVKVESGAFTHKGIELYTSQPIYTIPYRPPVTTRGPRWRFDFWRGVQGGLYADAVVVSALTCRTAIGRIAARITGGCRILIPAPR